MCACVPSGELWRYLEQLGIQQKVAHEQFGKPEDAIKTLMQRRWVQLWAPLLCWGGSEMQCGYPAATRPQWGVVVGPLSGHTLQRQGTHLSAGLASMQSCLQLGQAVSHLSAAAATPGASMLRKAVQVNCCMP